MHFDLNASRGHCFNCYFNCFPRVVIHDSLTRGAGANVIESELNCW
jgi:hypothetical protein